MRKGCMGVKKPKIYPKDIRFFPKNRKEVLLKAAYDLLKKAKEAHFVEQATCIIVYYDDAECDGYCLMEDIATDLGIDEE